MINASKTKFPTPFAAFIEARRLESFVDDPNLLPAFASSSIKVLPYQIAAARFALRSQYLKGCILCDEGSLGKTYEALLIIAQKWYEGKDNILVVLPKNLVAQWQKKLQEEFTLPIASWNAETKEKGVILISYDEAVKNATALEETVWNLVIFDEADFLFKPENKSVISLKKMVGNRYIPNANNTGVGFNGSWASMYCKTIFTFENGVMTDWTYEGNNCVSQ